MSDSEDDLTIRDKLAAAALPALIDRFSHRGNSIWVTDDSMTDSFDYDIKLIVIMAYRIADAMRKARLQSFT